MTIITVSIALIVVFLFGNLAQRWYLAFRRVRTIEARLCSHEAQVAKLRGRLEEEGRSIHPEGLIGWARHHASRLIETNSEKIASALKLAPSDPGEAELLEREITVGLAAARAVLDCTGQYLSRQSRIDNQKLVEFLDDLEGLRHRLGLRLDRHPSPDIVREERNRLEKLGERIAGERGTLRGDPAIGWCRVQALLNVLNDIDQRLEVKTGQFGARGR